MRFAIVEGDALAQLRRLIRRQGAENSRCVFALHRKTRVHHGVRQIAGSRKYQQTAGADVESPDRQPARAAQTRQLGKYGFAALRVFTRDNFALGLVIDQHPRRLRRRFDTNRAAIDLNAILWRHTRADSRYLAIDRDAPCFNPRFHCAA